MNEGDDDYLFNQQYWLRVTREGNRKGKVSKSMTRVIKKMGPGPWALAHVTHRLND